VNLRLSRLRAGEWLTAAAAILMLIDLFAPAWFAARAGQQSAATASAGHVSLNGWQTSLPAGVLALIVCGGGIAIWLTTATRRSPALPVVLNTLLLPFSLALVALVAIRVLVLRPSLHAAVVSTRSGAWAGLALSVALYLGLYVALRREGVAVADAPASIETVTVAPVTGEPRQEPHA
jgi:hypothetical protein